MMPHVKAGRVKALAMASEKRYSAAPGLPTISESAVPGYASGSWVGFLAPAGSPREIVAKLGKEIMAIVNRPDVRERFIQIGIEPVGNSPEEFTRFLRDEVAKWEKVIRTANVKVDN